MSERPEEKRRIYLDHAAATPLIPEVFSAMEPYLREEFGNASAVHAEGRSAKQAISAARQKIAETLIVRKDEVYFTGSGTESNNLAILGQIEALQAASRPYESMEVVMTKIEHPSLLALVPVLEKLGVKVKYAEVDERGLLNRAALLAALTESTVLVAFAYANSEIGTIQPVSRLVRQVREFALSIGSHIAVHLDAAQAPLWLPCDLPRLGVDTMTLDAGKCGGPKGVGVLVVKDSIQITNISFGGGQEAGLRPGTENIAGIVGAAEALARAQRSYEERSIIVRKVRDESLTAISSLLPQAICNGPEGEERLPNNINFSLPGFDTEYAVVWLDTHGVAASTKSACAGAGGGESHVVMEISGDKTRAKSTIRLTLGEETKVSDVKYAITTLADFTHKMKKLTN